MNWKTIVTALFFTVMSLAAIAYLVVNSQPLLLVSSIAWGVILSVGMLHGVASAPDANYERKRHWLQEVVVHAVLLGFFSAPCIPIAFWEGLFPAFASAWLILLGARLVFTASNWFLGPIEKWKRDANAVSDSSLQ